MYTGFGPGSQYRNRQWEDAVERRFDHRYPAGSWEARVELVPGSPAVNAGVRNISGAGAQLLVAQPADVGRIVKVDIGGFVLFGEVHYNNLEGDLFLVGIQCNPRLSRRELDDILSSSS